MLEGGEAGLAVLEDEHGGHVQNADSVKSGMKHAVEEWESIEKSTQRVKVESKVKAMASKLEDKVNNCRKKYKQGARIAKQEIELGIQPMIGRFLNDHGLAKRVPGGQREGGGDSGGVCVASSPRKRRISECVEIVACGSPGEKEKRKQLLTLLSFCSREREKKQHYWPVGTF